MHRPHYHTEIQTDIGEETLNYCMYYIFPPSLKLKIQILFPPLVVKVKEGCYSSVQDINNASDVQIRTDAKKKPFVDSLTSGLLFSPLPHSVSSSVTSYISREGPVLAHLSLDLHFL